MATAVCGDCDARVGWDDLSCHQCGKTFRISGPPKRPAPPKEPSASATIAWMFLASLVATAAVYYPLHLVPRDTHVVGAIVGTAITPVLFALLFTIKSPRAAWIAFVIFFLLAAFGRISEVVKESQGEASLSQALVDAARQQQRARDAAQMDFTRAPSPMVAGRDTVPGRLAEVVRTNSEKSVRMQLAYRKEIAQMGLEQTLAPQRLVSSTGIAESRGTLVRYEALLARMEQDESAAFASARSEVVQALGNAREATEILRGMDGNQAKVAATSQRMLVNQRANMTAQRELLDYMERLLGHVQTQKDELLFESDRHLRGYNALITRIGSLAQEEEAIRRESKAALDARVQMLEGARR